MRKGAFPLLLLSLNSTLLHVSSSQQPTSVTASSFLIRLLPLVSFSVAFPFCSIPSLPISYYNSIDPTGFGGWSFLGLCSLPFLRCNSVSWVSDINENDTGPRSTSQIFYQVSSLVSYTCFLDISSRPCQSASTILMLIGEVLIWGTNMKPKLKLGIWLLSLSSRVLSIMAEKAWYQEREAAFHIASAVKQKAVIAHAQLAFLFWFIPGLQSRECWCLCLGKKGECLPTSINTMHWFPYRHARSFFS